MSEPIILSGKEVSASVYESLKDKIEDFRDNQIIPGLAVVAVAA